MIAQRWRSIDTLKLYEVYPYSNLDTLLLKLLRLPVPIIMKFLGKHLIFKVPVQVGRNIRQTTFVL